MRKRSTKSAFSTRYALLKELLVDARHATGLTQADLASRLNRPQSFVSKYERGERRLDVVEFVDVARALRLDAFEVFSKIVGSRRP